MNTKVDNRILVKVFIGCRFHAEIKMLLNQSKAWKLATISSQPQTDSLCEVHYQQKDYIGLFLPQEKNTLNELKAYEKLVQDKLKEYCPSLENETLKMTIFPQIFIT